MAFFKSVLFVIRPKKKVTKCFLKIIILTEQTNIYTGYSKIKHRESITQESIFRFWRFLQIVPLKADNLVNYSKFKNSVSS